VSWFKNAFAIRKSDPGQLTEEQLAVLDKLAAKVCQYRLSLPATIFLESAKPLGLVGGQAMVCLRPFVNAFFNTREYDLLTSMLEDSNTVETLLNRIEALEQNSPKNH
jgi:hypothetical protein